MNFKKLFAILLSIAFVKAFGQEVSRKFDPINFSQVEVTDSFWKPTMELVATKTLAACIEQTEVKTPRIKNFEKVAAGEGEHEGRFYDDSDVFKALEAIAYSIKNRPDPELEKKADDWIDKIAAAQLEDGYLNTYYTLGRLDRRWTDMSMHEDYNGGHMIEAAIAYYNATGKRKFLDVSIKWADHFYSLFGPGKRHWVTGHQELELALVKLYKITNDQKYLDLAHWLLEERGKKLAVGYTWGDWGDTAYAQDVVPVREQTEITGHAVRAMYLYTGAADVASLTGDAGYMKAMKAVWGDVTERNMYITGGIGASGRNEGFGIDYDLPNEQAYCETCASVGMVFWNQRMNLLTGDSKYIDILERSLYNGARDGLSLSGDRFFYGNPLASRGQHSRREWFGTACCPSNVARLIASLGDYIYGSSKDAIWVNLFISSKTTIKVKNSDVQVSMETNYPWEGSVKISINPQGRVEFPVHIRIPGWVQGKPVPGDLYKFADNIDTPYQVKLNGNEIPFTLENGYAVMTNRWKKGDEIELVFPMEVRKIVAREEVQVNKGRIALQRGPLVYCVEGVDNGGKAWNFIVPENTRFASKYDPNKLGGITTIQFDAPVMEVVADGSNISSTNKTITAIPYYSWANRGSSEMQVWLPIKISDVKINYR